MNVLDLVYSRTKKGEIYGAADIANAAGIDRETAERVMGFLIQYGFVKALATRHEVLVEWNDSPDPSLTVKLLRKMIAQA
jgi:DNA-binding IclR family transcriptional regulator